MSCLISLAELNLMKNMFCCAAQDLKRLASSCLHAAAVLHAAGVVHTDLRLRNTEWLDEQHCMVTSLEHCRQADQPLPKDVPFLKGWDGGTLERRGRARFFTPASDLHQIGRLLQQVPVRRSALAGCFIQLLLGKKSERDPRKPLTAEEALQHAWLQGEDEQPGTADDAMRQGAGGAGGGRGAKRKTVGKGEVADEQGGAQAKKRTRGRRSADASSGK